MDESLVPVFPFQSAYCFLSRLTLYVGILFGWMDAVTGFNGFLRTGGPLKCLLVGSFVCAGHSFLLLVVSHPIIDLDSEPLWALQIVIITAVIPLLAYQNLFPHERTARNQHFVSTFWIVVLVGMISVCIARSRRPSMADVAKIADITKVKSWIRIEGDAEMKPSREVYFGDTILFYTIPVFTVIAIVISFVAVAMQYGKNDYAQFPRAEPRHWRYAAKGLHARALCVLQFASVFFTIVFAVCTEYVLWGAPSCQSGMSTVSQWGVPVTALVGLVAAKVFWI